MTPVTSDGHPDTSTRRPRGDRARAELFDAALEAFAERGFHGTGTRDIAAAAGMSAAAMYVHHRSKEDLLFAIAKEGHEQAFAVIEQASSRATDPVAQLREAVRDYTAWHARSHTLARVVQYELGALGSEHAQEIGRLRRAIEVWIRALVEAGIQAGDFEVSHPKMTALAILSLGIDVARWYRDDKAWTPEEIGDHYSELALRMVGHGGVIRESRTSSSQ
jgi:AcrR family transcriptional regulator